MSSSRPTSLEIGMGNEGLLRVMFVCRQNSRRSQIAHGFLVDRAPEGVEVSSAGLDGAGGLAAGAKAPTPCRSIWQNTSRL